MNRTESLARLLRGTRLPCHSRDPAPSLQRMQVLSESCLVADSVSQKTVTLSRFKLNVQDRADLEVQP